MTDKPILFSAPMVRALLEGRKTQTRRVLKKPTWAQDAGWPDRIMDEQDLDGRLQWFAKDTGCLSDLPIYQPCDRLWVRETTATWEGRHRDVVYRADVSDSDWSDLLHDARSGAAWKVRNGIFCPRWASRLTLTVTDVRVQRVREIIDDDALAEGVECAACPVAGRDIDIDGQFWPGGPARMFRDLWDSLNAKRGFGWDENPWVAAYTFTVERRNIDAEESKGAT